MKKALIRTSLLLLGCTALLLSPALPAVLGIEAASPSDTSQVVLDPEAARLQQGRAAEETSGPPPAEHLRKLEQQNGKPPEVTALSVSVTSGIEPKPAPAPGSASAGPTPKEGVKQLEQEDGADIQASVNSWVNSLAKEKGFEAWSGARWDIYPLGPGTHSWVVILQNNKQEVGYLVVAAAENGGYKLVEYGTGGNPLFSLETLYRSSVQLGLIPEHTSKEAFLKTMAAGDSRRVRRLYAPPLQAVWEITGKGSKRYLDAKTGEELPDLSEWAADNAQSDAGTETGTISSPKPNSKLKVSEAAEWEAFDPFEKAVWLKGKRLPAGDFQDWLHKASKSGTRLTHSAKWFGGAALYPLAVTGYHTWSGGSSYIRLEQDGPRFVPYEAATSLGGFYPQVSPPLS